MTDEHGRRSEPREITRLLRSWNEGDEAALERLFPLVYDNLRAMAGRLLTMERRDHTLQPTALVNELYFRLVEQQQVAWRERSQFFAIASRLMRRILVDHARHHGRAKRGAGRRKVTLDEAHSVTGAPSPELLDLAEGITRLATIEPLQASVVEMRFFGGLSVEETGEILGCSRSTVKRHWKAARKWLYSELGRPRAVRP